MARIEAKFKLKGVKAMERRIQKLADEFEDKIKGALRIEAELIMTKAKQKYVPVAPGGGPLRASGHVKTPARKGKEVSVTLAFGGPAAPYALAVHEHPSSHSPPSWKGKTIEEIDWNIPGTGPKYLEKAFNDAVPGMDKRLAKRLGLD